MGGKRGLRIHGTGSRLPPDASGPDWDSHLQWVLIPHPKMSEQKPQGAALSWGAQPQGCTAPAPSAIRAQAIPTTPGVSQAHCVAAGHDHPTAVPTGYWMREREGILGRRLAAPGGLWPGGRPSVLPGQSGLRPPPDPVLHPGRDVLWKLHPTRFGFWRRRQRLATRAGGVAAFQNSRRERSSHALPGPGAQAQGLVETPLCWTRSHGQGRCSHGGWRPRGPSLGPAPRPFSSVCVFGRNS